MANFVGIAIGVAIALTVLTAVIAPQVTTAQADPNLADYSGLLGIVILAFIALIVFAVTRGIQGKGKGGGL